MFDIPFYASFMLQLIDIQYIIKTKISIMNDIKVSQVVLYRVGNKNQKKV